LPEKTVIRLGNVSKPTITIHRPPAGKDTGAAVLVCPGGAYSILALDLEGTEVCDWLNSIGVTGVLLKYRVPKRSGLEKHTAALQDTQRALGLVRHRASEWGIDPARLGVLGFSAGGHLSAALCSSAAQRTYPTVDDADKISCRPDFTVLIYPAYLALKDEDNKIAPEVSVTTNTPPTFIAMAEDDPVRVENALFYALALKQAKVPVELHVYPVGGPRLRPATHQKRRHHLARPRGRLGCAARGVLKQWSDEEWDWAAFNSIQVKRRPFDKVGDKALKDLPLALWKSETRAFRNLCLTFTR